MTPVVGLTDATAGLILDQAPPAKVLVKVAVEPAHTSIAPAVFGTRAVC